MEYLGADPDDDTSQDYDYLWNSMWLIILTMTTVGYGDFYPRSHPGRLVGVLACFWGVFLVSMMVVTLTVSSEFTRGEERAFDILQRLKAKEVIKTKASIVIQSLLRLAVFKNRRKHAAGNELYLFQKYQLEAKLERSVEQFRSQRLQQSKQDLPAEEMLRQLTEKLDMDLDVVKNELATMRKLEQLIQNVENRQNRYIEDIRHAIESTMRIQELLVKFKSNVQSKQETIMNHHGNTQGNALNTNGANSNIIDALVSDKTKEEPK
eukprot:CAMPEP_0115029258 /NCGR_PEP_ID=MMETSP0216-20121206/36872_1 /TAXON_ID=223996 /ORGANISM="Protocruzia adherens, Strain Boccale" /LENGTH=264 /DNA_ID=CAMNT_0002405765 /DNA_START=556 /DNA_END=1350 /DNA_ORIENTATION=+